MTKNRSEIGINNMLASIHDFGTPNYQFWLNFGVQKFTKNDTKSPLGHLGGPWDPPGSSQGAPRAIFGRVFVKKGQFLDSFWINFGSNFEQFSVNCRLFCCTHIFQTISSVLDFHIVFAVCPSIHLMLK